MDLTNEKTLIEVLKKHNLWAKKRFGQNFLISRYVLKKIVATGEINSRDNVIEIGPGLGTLTVELEKHAKKVTAIEADKELISLLKDYTEKAEIICGDALKFTPPNTPYKVIANIPYQITSPLLTHFLTAKKRPTKIVFLVQKEVAEKICNTKKQSVLSLQVQIFGKPRIIKKVPRTAFYPQPKVDSAILKIEIYNRPLVKNAEKILALAKKAFNQKRKKLSNSVKITDPKFKDKRPEDLTIKHWQDLLS